MNEASFLIDVNKANIVLNKANLLGKINHYNISSISSCKYSSDFYDASRNGDYYYTYRCAMENDDYDLLLYDGSFIQFSYDKRKEGEIIRYAYYPAVFSLNYRDFLTEMGFSIEDVGIELIEDFQQYILEQNPQFVTPMRYDYDNRLYKETIHSASHLHFGYEDNIRIPIDAILRSSAFAKLIIEYYYYPMWKDVLSRNDKSFLYDKSELNDLDKALFTDNDKKVPYYHFHQ